MQKRVPYVAQLGNMDCSIACMTMLFRYYGLDVDIVDVGQVVHIGRDGVNLTQLKQATQQFGFKCTAYRYNKQKNILDSNLPAVVYSSHWIKDCIGTIHTVRSHKRERSLYNIKLKFREEGRSFYMINATLNLT